MGENSSIQWTTHTFNPWVGCQRVSPGCEHCYAEAYDKRVGGAKLPDGSKSLRWGPQAPRVRTSPANWRKPLAWNKAAAEGRRRDRVFCSSLADVFEDRPELVEWRKDLFGLIRATPSLDWLLLTKRPGNITRLWPLYAMRPGHARQVTEVAECPPPGDEAWPNIWLGTTVEDQRRANERIPELVKVPAAVRFLSCEPLLERVDLDRRGELIWRACSRCGGSASLPVDGGGRACPDCLDHQGAENAGIDWIIIGGESGPGARPFHLEWARDLVRQCRAAGVAPFVKQLGQRPTVDYYQHMRELDAGGFDTSSCVALGWSYRDGQPPPGSRAHYYTGDSHGGEPAEWPEDLRVRESPEVTR